LIVGGGSAGQPPASLSCFAGQVPDEGTSLMPPRHQTKNLHQQRSRFYFITSSDVYGTTQTWQKNYH